MQDKGLTCMFVGYAKDHVGNCYRMYNPATSRIHSTRDVKWLGRKYYDSVRFQNPEFSTFGSGKVVKHDEEDVYIVIDYNEDSENSNNFSEAASSSSSESDSNDESNKEDKKSDSKDESDGEYSESEGEATDEGDEPCHLS